MAVTNIQSRRDLLAQVCRASFREFARRFWQYIPGVGKLVWSWHLDVFCDELQKIAERVFHEQPAEYDLAVNVSPGTSKSSFISVLFPAWVWTWFPICRILTASHTSDLVLDLASKSRDVIQSELYRELFPDVDIREDTNAKGHYRNSQGGERKVCTVGGMSPTGFHCHIAVVDDPIDPKKVLSELEVKTAADFMTNVLPNRKVDKRVSTIVLVMQRLGLGDPTDVMLKEGAKEGARTVRHICLPAELTEDTTPEFRGYYINGLMDKTRLGPEVLAENKARGRLFYATQFLQKPYAAEGSMFKPEWFRKFVRAAPYKVIKRIRYWDRGATDGGGCRTAGTLMANDGEFFYIENVAVGQWGWKERNDKIVSVAQLDMMRYGPNDAPVVYIEAERGSTGEESYANIARRLINEVPGVRIREDMPSGSKDTRAEPLADALAAGLVYLVNDGSWDIPEYVREFVAFKPDPTVKRTGRYLDRVDASSGAYNLLSGRKQGRLLRTFAIRDSKKKGGLRFVVVSKQQLARTIIEVNALLIVLNDPTGVCHAAAGETPHSVVNGVAQQGGAEPPDVNRCALVELGASVLSSSLPAGGNAVGIHETDRGPTPPPLPPHGLNRLVDSLTLTFADVDPQEHQQTWGDILPAYGRKCEEVMMSRDDAKKLWHFLRKKRDRHHEIIVIAEDGDEDRRGRSLAYAVADVMGLKPRPVETPEDQEAKHDGAAPNPFVFATVKTGRELVL